MKKYLVAIDGSKNSREALRTAMELSEKFEAELIVLYVKPKMDAYRHVEIVSYEKAYREAEERRAEMILGEAKNIVGENENVQYVTINGDPAKAIVEYAGDNNITTIVMGSRGLGGMTKLLVGSVSSKVLSHAPCSVYIIR